MKMAQILARKRDGRKLSREEIGFVVRGAADGSIPDYQLSAFLMAVCIRGMDEEETGELTMQMAQSGDIADLSAIAGIKVDKHSTGGVGDLTSLVALPLAACCGVVAPKMSGRGLGHTGGTLDKLWSIPGCRTNLSMDEFISQVASVGCAIIGQTGAFAPVDKKLYALRDVTGTVESLPLIVSSILSKKFAAGCDAMVLDVKTGDGAFMQTLEQSMELARAMVLVARKAGKRAVALVTDMDQPLGRCIGNAIEVAEAARILRGKETGRARELCLQVAACMTELGVGAAPEEARARVEQALCDGRGLLKLKEMLSAQGGNADALDDPSLLPQPGCTLDVVSRGAGYVSSIGCRALGLAACDLGAGRERAEDEVDPSVGIELLTGVGEYVDTGRTLARVFARNSREAEECAEKILGCIRLSPQRPPERPLVFARIS